MYVGTTTRSTYRAKEGKSGHHPKDYKETTSKFE